MKRLDSGELLLGFALIVLLVAAVGILFWMIWVGGR